MATQKENEKQDSGEQGPQGITVQRGQQNRQIEREGGQLARRVTQTDPRSMMRRMLDDLDTITWSPFTGTTPFSMMRRMFDDMERIFDTDIFSDVFSDVDRRTRMAAWAPRVEITQHGDKLIVRADLPGISQDEINLSAEGNALVIEGERAVPSEDQQGDVWHSERPYGRFRRVVALPEGADLENAEARYQNGVLEVSIPIPVSQARGRRIEIRTEDQAEQGQNPQLKETAAQQQQAEQQSAAQRPQAEQR